MQTLPNGTTLGEYTLIRLIGRGGMGEVYEAYEAKLHRRVALKIIAPLQPDEHDYEDLFRRFLQEARTLAQVNHPNIVTIYDIDRLGGAQFIAMEYVNGMPLKQMLKEVSVSMDEAVPMFAQILDGLICLHDNHIIHRDLKPHNILLRTDGQIKILDFGIAKQMLPGHLEGTSVGVIAGTLPYMAPEVKIGDPASVCSDIWGLGAIFYELIIGRPLTRVMLDYPNTTEVPWTREDMSRIPQGMRNIINKMCAYNMKDRFQKTIEVADELKRFRQSRPAVPPEVYDSVVKKVAAIAELKRKEVTNDFSFTSLRNNSPMATGLRPLNPERRKSKRKSERKHVEYMPYMATVGVVIAGLGTWLALKNTSHAPTPMPQPIVNPALLPSPTPTPVAQAPVRDTPPVLLEPKDQDVLWLDPSRIPTLSWTRSLNKDFEIQIAMDARFKKIIIAELVSGTSFRPETVLPEGKYYWRLEPKSGVGPVSGPFRFTISHLKPVELVGPNPQHVIDLKSSEGYADVDFSWKCKPGGKFYRIQISPSSDFGTIVKEQVLQTCQYKAGNVPVGTFSWRVRLEDSPQQQALWSEVRALTVKAPHTPPPPVPKITRSFENIEPKIKKPLSTFTLQFRGQPRDLAALHKNLTEVPRLEWVPVKGARAYTVQMSDNKEFTQGLAEEKTNSPFLDLKNPSPGRFFWRVRALDANGLPTEFSPRAMAILNLPAPKLKDSYKLTRQGGNAPTLEWEPVAVTGRYLIQFGKGRNLASSEERLVEGPKVEVDEAPGKYHMRVAAANDAGEAISVFSDAAVVMVDQGSAMEKPKAITPGQGARAPSSDGRLSVKFSWSPVATAEIYSIELATDSEFTQIIQKLRTPQSSFVLKQAQLKGRVYWRVRGESGKGNSDWSTPSYFDVR